MPGSDASFGSVFEFYRELFMLYVRVDRTIDLQIWAARTAAFACFLPYVYVDLQAGLWVTGALLPFSIDPDTASVRLADARLAFAGSAQVTAMAGVGPGDPTLCSAMAVYMYRVTHD